MTSPAWKLCSAAEPLGSALVTDDTLVTRPCHTVRRGEPQAEVRNSNAGFACLLRTFACCSLGIWPSVSVNASIDTGTMARLSNCAGQLQSAAWAICRVHVSARLLRVQLLLRGVLAKIAYYQRR
jgi:hypothetical protein